MAKYIKLSDVEKDEIRRLTQLANRRIKAATVAYEKEGRTIAPDEVTGGVQRREQWHTKTTPLSRSVKFENRQDYLKQLHYLRRFEHSRPNMTEYNEIQREKTVQGIEESVGQNAPKKVIDMIRKMTAPQLSNFWTIFSRKAAQLGFKYSSSQALADTLNEMFPEEFASLAQGLATNISKRKE